MRRGDQSITPPLLLHTSKPSPVLSCSISEKSFSSLLICEKLLWHKLCRYCLINIKMYTMLCSVRSCYLRHHIYNGSFCFLVFWLNKWPNNKVLTFTNRKFDDLTVQEKGAGLAPSVRVGISYCSTGLDVRKPLVPHKRHPLVLGTTETEIRNWLINQHYLTLGTRHCFIKLIIQLVGQPHIRETALTF